MLPLEVVIKLAFSIQDAADLFAFLKALRPSNNLGPLEELLQLALTHDHSDLWPSLRLGSSMLDPASLSSCEAIIKYYSRVIVEDTWHDVAWLKRHLNCKTSIEWRVNRLPGIIDRLDAWTDLRITALRLQVDDRSETAWKKVLPRLHHLTTLQVDDIDGDMGDLYEIVAKSSQITELKALVIGMYQLDKRDLVNLIEWFRRQPVRVFEAELSNWGYLDNDLRQTLCEAMFNCPTMDSLRIMEGSYFEGIDFTKFTFPMQRLRLLSQMTSDTVRSFSCQLEHSNLNFLELADYDEENIEGVQLLLKVLPRTSIKHLNFIALQMTPANWCTLAPSFENCGLERLLLVTEGFSSDFIYTLAAAMETNDTISELYLATQSIDLPTLDVLIQSFSKPSRQVSAKRTIKLNTFHHAMDLSHVKYLEELAATNSCEFIQAEIEINSIATLNFQGS